MILKNPVSLNRMILPHTGLRGIAALLVFMTHLGHETKITLGINPAYFPQFYLADFAVDLFFILSGFILNWVYFKSGNQIINWKDYLKARCVRILPLYYLTLCAYLTPLIQSIRYNGWLYEHGKDFLLLFGNLSLFSGIAGVTHWDWTLNAPAWSISIEFFAYLFLFPPLVFLFKKTYQEKVFFSLLIITVLGMLLCYANINHLLMEWNWTRFARGVFGFPLGFLICILFKRTEVKRGIAVDAVNLTAIVIIFLSLYSFLPSILILCVLPFIVYFTAFDKGYFCKFLNIKINQWLGERSYSIYLCHIPIMYVYFIPMRGTIDSFISLPKKYHGAINVFLVIVAVFLVSELSYRYFETPIRYFFRRKSQRESDFDPVKVGQI